MRASPSAWCLFGSCLWVVGLLGGPSLAPAQEVIEVPPIGVEAPVPETSERPRDRADTVEDPLALEAPAGPIREAAMAPAVVVREAGGVGQAQTIQIRGSDPASSLSALDGVPLNSPFLGGADLSGLSLLPLESLAVTRGGHSALWGSDAVGGVLEASLPSPMDHPGSRLSWTVGSFGTMRMKVSHAGVSEPLAALVALGLLSSSGNFPFTDTNGRRRTRTHNATSALDALTKVEAEWADRHRAVLLVEGFRDDRDVPGLEQFPSRTARQEDSRIIVSARWSGPGLFADEGRTGAHLYARRLGFAFEDTAPPIGPPVRTRLTAWEVAGEGFGEEAATRWSRFPWTVRASHTRGVVARSEQKVRAPSRSSVAGRAGVAVGPWSGRIQGEVVLRIEWNEGFGVIALPRGEVRFSPSRPLAVFASVARAFRLPTFEELHFEAGFVQGNPGLRPEDAWTWDVGASFSTLDSTADLRIAFFENRVSNLILFLPRSAFLIRAENSGSALLRGVELDGSVRIGPCAVRAAYTFLDARFRGGRRMPHRPRHTLAGEVTLEWRQWRAQVRARGQTAVFLDRYESLSEEGRLFVDGRLEWTPIPEATFALDIHNVLDRRGAVDSLQSPLPGRAFYGSLLLSL